MAATFHNFLCVHSFHHPNGLSKSSMKQTTPCQITTELGPEHCRQRPCFLPASQAGSRLLSPIPPQHSTPPHTPHLLSTPHLLTPHTSSAPHTPLHTPHLPTPCTSSASLLRKVVLPFWPWLSPALCPAYATHPCTSIATPWHHWILGGCTWLPE